MSTGISRCQIAVAEGPGMGCPPLGRALRFALFVVERGDVRGPVYRIRHDNPGQSCTGHADLLELLADCQVVIAGSVGGKLTARLHDAGVTVIATSDTGTAEYLAAQWAAGQLGQRVQTE